MTTRANAPSINEATVKALSQRLNEPEWLLQRRLDAWRAYEAMAMPNPLDEEWRRTDLTRVDLDEALAGTEAASSKLRTEDLPKGVVFSDLSKAASAHEALVQQHLHNLVKPSEWKLGALQAAAWQGGALVHVREGVEVAVPLTYAVRQNGAPLLSHLLIVAEPNSSVTVIRDSTGEAASGWSLASGAVEIVAGPDSRVRFVDLQRMGQRSVASFSTIRAQLDRGADVSAALIGLGGALTRTRLEVTLAGEGSRAELLGLAFGNEKQHFDYLTLQDHIAPRTASDLLFKAALDDEASTVWRGLARIQKGAGQSEANQTSRNLLLSDHAKAAPIPILEIEAYDVLRCSHGATAGPLDEDQRFYLESRGVPPVEAQQLLVEAFFREVLDRLPAGVDQDALEAAIAHKLEAVG
ncbi:MAG TPA: Fe-S cluster assembly protein SufD [Dehalococcoidia bacterium]|nr:Fe-S cluster assembly protein SufD [Dehalococcoidia bacterium]